MTEIRSISIRKDNKYLFGQLEVMVPEGTSFTDSITMAVEAYVRGPRGSMPNLFDDINIWRERIGELPEKDIEILHKQIKQLNKVLAERSLRYVI